MVYNYPQISETYIHEELASLWDDYEIKIVTMGKENLARKSFFPYELISFDQGRQNDLLILSRWRKERFGQNQLRFVENIKNTIETFQPQVIHSHWFFHAPLLAMVAERYQTPFTIRTHSFDLLKSNDSELSSYCQAANNSLCKAVLVFPPFKDILINHGLKEDKIIQCWPVLNYNRFLAPKKRSLQKRILGIGPALYKKNHKSFIDLAVLMQESGFEFNLYITGYIIDEVRDYNRQMGNPVKFIGHVEPEEMPEIYKQHDWLILTSDPKINTVGLPIGVAEAQASGIGVCLQELPNRRIQQLDYMGGGGFLYNSIAELPAILTKPYPESMRLKGIENAKKCDIQQHKELLTSVWKDLN